MQPDAGPRSGAGHRGGGGEPSNVAVLPAVCAIRFWSSVS
jgi:hypothetical protein